MYQHVHILAVTEFDARIDRQTARAKSRHESVVDRAQEFLRDFSNPQKENPNGVIAWSQPVCPTGNRSLACQLQVVRIKHHQSSPSGCKRLAASAAEKKSGQTMHAGEPSA